MVKAVALCLVLFSATGCVTPLSSSGRLVREVPLSMTENCEYLGVATSSHGTAWTTAGDREAAWNKAYNEAAAMGGNAIVVNQSATSQLVTVARAQVYVCPDLENRRYKTVE